MKLYLNTTKMAFEGDNIEHNIIRGISNEEFLGYDKMVELPDDDKFIKDTLKYIYKKDKKGEDTEEIDHIEFIVREQETWNSFPLYEIVNDEIVKFNYKNYAYFENTDRRMALAFKIKELYNSSSEAKILRKTFKHIMDTLDIEYPDFFKKYNDKIEEIINKNQKGGRKDKWKN